MAKWNFLQDTLLAEETERREEGCNTAGFRERILACEGDTEKLMRVYADLRALPIAPDFPYSEPDAWDDILASSDGIAEPGFSGSDDELQNKLYGAWLGRCAGCALGKPVETWPFVAGHGGKRGYEWVREWLEGANAYPLNDYFPEKSTLAEQGWQLRFPGSQKEHIAFMETDDDIRYLVLGLLLNEKKGNDFGWNDVADNWCFRLPAYETFTAERAAYQNYLTAPTDDPDEKRAYCNTYLNPYREWIGAQIRVDHYAYVNAGYPLQAAHAAFEDARFSHVKNGVYGAMFVAACIASAAVETDPERIVRAGMRVIPKTSRLYSDLEQAISIAHTAKTAPELHARLWDAYGHYNWVHTNNNACCVAASLIFGQGDFEKAITTAVACGWDTDCNGATVGSIMGMILGARALPEKWIAPLHDTLYSGIPDFHPIAVSACASRTLAVWKKLHG